MRKIISIAIFICGSFSILEARDFTPSWTQNQFREISAFTSTQKVLGTHYFYWYEFPGQHFFDNGEQTDDALQDHFSDAKAVSFNSVDWHAQQLQDITDAGIDFILPVYWGVVDNYFSNNVRFSIAGLGPLQLAMDQRTREGKKSPKIGLFYDTSTLDPGVRGELNNTKKYDLRLGTGKDIFYRTIRDFFDQIHPKNWAAIDGRPIVVLYSSGFAQNYDQSTFEYIYQKFAQDFGGIKPYIIRDNSWNVKSDAVTSWGAALSGPVIFGNVAEIGAGYNDTAVPGRTTPIRERENGNFYRLGWNKILNSSAKIVLIETWDEMHEGTDLCNSKEYGRLYIDLTKKYGDMFRQNQPGNEQITLEHPTPVPHPPSTVGEEYRNAQSVSATLGDQGKEAGLWLIRSMPDGVVYNSVIGGSPCTQTAQGAIDYMYFSIADPFLYNTTEPVRITLSYWDAGFTTLIFQYDSHDPKAVLDGAYKDYSPITCGKSNQWKTISFELTDAVFMNRENGGSDFRICAINGSAAVKEISVNKVNAAHNSIKLDQ